MNNPIEYIPVESDFEFAKREELTETDDVFAGESNEKAAFRKFFSKKINIFAVVLLLMLIIMSIVGPYLTGNPSNEQNLSNSNLPPHIPIIADGNETMHMSDGDVRINRYKENGIENVYYIFGTDDLGRDLFSRCWQGLRISLIVALAATLINFLIGMNYGMISGYIGGKTDMVLQRIIEIAGSIPSLVVVTLLMLIMKQGMLTIIFALMLTGWMEMSTIARTHTLRLKEQEFVLAAKTQGAGKSRIIYKEIFPNLFGALMTQAMIDIPAAIFMESFLSFVGIGMPVEKCSLGTLISTGFNNTLLHPYKIIPPVIILVLLMISCNIISDGLKDAFDLADRK